VLTSSQKQRQVSSKARWLQAIGGRFALALTAIWRRRFGFLEKSEEQSANAEIDQKLQHGFAAGDASHHCHGVFHSRGKP
jgi:hypothetical protein